LVLLIFSLFAGVFVPEVAGLTPFNTGTKVSTLGMVGTILLTACLMILILAIFASANARKTAEIERNPYYIKKIPHGSFTYYVLLYSSLLYYTFYADQQIATKINVMLRQNPDYGIKKVSYSATAFAVAWTVFLSPVFFIVSFIFVNGILLNSAAAHAAIFNLDFAAIGAIIEATLDTLAATLINMPPYIGILAIAGWIILLICISLATCQGVANVRDRLRELAKNYRADHKTNDDNLRQILDDIIEWYMRDTSVYTGAGIRSKTNWAAFEVLRRIQNRET
jgi:hypothetical protein